MSPRAWSGRLTMGVWRLKKQTIGVASVLVMLGFVYIQYGQSDALLPQTAPRREELGTGETVQNKVSFVSEKEKSSHEEANNKARRSSGDHPELSQFDPSRVLYKPALDIILKGKLQKSEDDITTQQPSERGKTDHSVLHSAESEIRDSDKNQKLKSSIEPGPIEFPQQDLPLPGFWGGSHYKFNTFNEPVYNQNDNPFYVPPHRVMHFDLKGAPPRMNMILQILPWLVAQGATAILMEYEDMFPWHGFLAETAAKNHYTRNEIMNFVSACKKHQLEVIPLIQTFGHLEYALKHEHFSKLREVPQLPQALCPSQNQSMTLIEMMIDQMMELHPDVRFLHIGCDEVYHMGECDLCRMTPRDTLFLKHVAKVATYVRNKHGAIPLIWDDMLRHISESAMKQEKLGDLVEPMVWVYAEDVYRFVQPSQWSKYAQIFPNIWAASAFKGAFGEQLTVPNVRRHLDNNMNWLVVMSVEGPKFANGFRGLVLTGWQRYDHFASLCELLPASLPSLAVTLIATSHGFFNSTVQNQLYDSLKCMQTPKYQTWLNIDADPFLWDKFSWCFFPGAQMFKVTVRLDATRREVDAYLDKVTKSRAWLTEYNQRHNFSSPMRIDEDLEELPGRLHSVSLLMRTARVALAEWFDEWTVGEWLELHIWPMMKRLKKLQEQAEGMKSVRNWPARPLPLLSELKAYDVLEPPSRPKQEV